MTQLYLILITILGIGFLIFIHEAGHYICARLVKMRVLVFSLGFGPRLCGIYRGGTDYRISLMPIGGYVRVAGEEAGDPTDGAMQTKSVGARVLYFAGGVMMNLLFALVAFPIVFKAGVEFTAPVVGAVQQGSPAWEADLRQGDRVVAVAGKSMYSFSNMQVEIALGGDNGVDLEIDRQGQHSTKKVFPRYDDQVGLYTIGISSPTLPGISLVVDEKSPAHAAGVRTGDQLVTLAGKPVDQDNLGQLVSDIGFSRRPVTVGVRRDGNLDEFTYTPELRPVPNPVIGVRVASRQVMGYRPGVALVQRLGLARGDHIIAIDGQRFDGSTLEPFAQGPPQLTLEVRRADESSSRHLSAPATGDERRDFVDWVALGPDAIDAVVLPQPDSPAAVAGLHDGDNIVAVNDEPIHNWDDLRGAVRAGGRRPLQLRVATAEGPVKLELRPATEQADLGWQINVTALLEPYRRDTIGGAIKAGMVSSLDLIKSLYVTLKKLFTGEVAAKNLGGIITISRVSYLFAESGWQRFVYFLALLSINLAFINVLPIPVLDGGALMFLAIEGIKGSPVHDRVLNYSQILGLVFIVALLVFVTYNDILRLL